MTHVVITQVVMTTAGCVYDWDVGSPAASSSSSSGSSASSSGGTGGNGGSDGGSDCAELKNALDMARANAKACVFGTAGQCNASIMDERGCKSWVNDGASTQAATFSQSVQDFIAAGCTPSSETCGLTQPSCLFVAGKPICVP